MGPPSLSLSQYAGVLASDDRQHKAVTSSGANRSKTLHDFSHSHVIPASQHVCPALAVARCRERTPTAVLRQRDDFVQLLALSFRPVTAEESDRDVLAEWL